MLGYLIISDEERNIVWGKNNKWFMFCTIDGKVDKHIFDCLESDKEFVNLYDDNIDDVLKQLTECKKGWNESLFHNFCRVFPLDTYKGAITKVFKDCKLYKF